MNNETINKISANFKFFNNTIEIKESITSCRIVDRNPDKKFSLKSTNYSGKIPEQLLNYFPDILETREKPDFTRKNILSYSSLISSERKLIIPTSHVARVTEIEFEGRGKARGKKRPAEKEAV